jgi:hypothetical protein
VVDLNELSVLPSFSNSATTASQNKDLLSSLSPAGEFPSLSSASYSWPEAWAKSRHCWGFVAHSCIEIRVKAYCHFDLVATQTFSIDANIMHFIL